MTTLTTKPRPTRRFDDARRRRPAGRPAPQRSHGRRPTLEDRLAGAWRDAKATGITDCPMCGGQMTHTGDHARCGSCGTQLS